MNYVNICLTGTGNFQLEIAGKTLMINSLPAGNLQLHRLQSASNGRAGFSAPPTFQDATPNEDFDKTDAVLFTHFYLRNYEEKAAEFLLKNLPVLCQPRDAHQFKQAGFLQVLPIENNFIWEGFRISRISFRKNNEEGEEEITPQTGFYLETNDQRILIVPFAYLNDQLKEALIRFQPDVVVLNASARTNKKEPHAILPDGIILVARFIPEAKIVLLDRGEQADFSRKDLLNLLAKNKLSTQCLVTEIGQKLKFNTEAKPKPVNQRIVEQLYRLFKLRDLKGLKMVLSEDIVWHQMKGFPEGKTLVGRDAVFSGVFGRLTDEWLDWKAAVDKVLDAGDTIIVTGYYEGTFKATHRKAHSKFAHLYTLQDGKIVLFQQYADTALVAEAMGLMKEKNSALM